MFTVGSIYKTSGTQRRKLDTSKQSRPTHPSRTAINRKISEERRRLQPTRIRLHAESARDSRLLFNANADDAITRSLAVEPDNYDGLKLRTKLQLTYHRFAEALETARHMQTFRNDDHDVWGQITDALVELGDYPGAVKAAQTMVDLRPDSSSYARVSYLRSLHGDTKGAIEAMIAAAKSG